MYKIRTRKHINAGTQRPKARKGQNPFIISREGKKGTPSKSRIWSLGRHRREIKIVEISRDSMRNQGIELGYKSKIRPNQELESKGREG